MRQRIQRNLDELRNIFFLKYISVPLTWNNSYPYFMQHLKVCITFLLKTKKSFFLFSSHINVKSYSWYWGWNITINGSLGREWKYFIRLCFMAAVLSVRSSGCLALSLSPRLTFGLSIAHHFNCLYISQVKWKKWMKPSIEKWAWGIRTDVNPNGSDNRQNWWTWGGSEAYEHIRVCIYILRVMVARGTLPGTKISMAPHALDISQVLCGIYGMRHKWMDDNV